MPKISRKDLIGIVEQSFQTRYPLDAESKEKVRRVALTTPAFKTGDFGEPYDSPENQCPITQADLPISIGGRSAFAMKFDRLITRHTFMGAFRGNQYQVKG
jgi:hypothetical protein